LKEENMKDCKIAFLGGGNMALSLIGGLIADGFSPEHIHVADPDSSRLEPSVQTMLFRRTLITSAL